MFLFSFYCRGISWSDLVQLKMSNIDGEMIRYSRQKTKNNGVPNEYFIKINKELSDIINLYNINKSQDDYLFPVLSKSSPEKTRKQIKDNLKTYNKNIGKICQLCNITHNFNITSKVSRHSWASIAIEIGEDIPITSEGCGHTNISTTMIYVKTNNEEVHKANDRIINSINSMSNKLNHTITPNIYN